jgi:hypothetical protein
MTVIEVIQDFWAAVFRQENGIPEPKSVTPEPAKE